MDPAAERATVEALLARYRHVGALTPELAMGFAAEAHAGQVDRVGEPYIGHVLRVALTAPGYGDGLDAAVVMTAGALHDLVEDTTVELADLAALGVPGQVLEAVDLLTRRDGDDYLHYVRRLAPDPLARAVKQADLADNSDPVRLARLQPDTRRRLAERYGAAREVLTSAR